MTNLFLIELVELCMRRSTLFTLCLKFSSIYFPEDSAMFVISDKPCYVIVLEPARGVLIVSWVPFVRLVSARPGDKNYLPALLLRNFLYIYLIS